MAGTMKRRASSAAISRSAPRTLSVDESKRQVSFVLSTSAVARDNHTIATAGWSTANYLANPVLLWAHDTAAPPVGKCVGLSTVGDELRGTFEFADAETYPFADTVYRLLKGDYLNAVSVSWDPIKWSYTADKSRPGGIDFTKQDLLEVSVVPVPSLTTALATARAAGIDTTPLTSWTEQKRVAQPRLIDLAKTATRADRAKYARLLAFDGARQHGIPVPACFLPARDKLERDALARCERLRRLAKVSKPPTTRADRESILRGLRVKP